MSVDGQKPSVLVVEDSSFERQMIRSAIGTFCTLTEAATLADGEEALKRQAFALIILDRILPDGDGIRFCEKVRSESVSYVPVIFLTGRSEIEDRVSGFAVGGDDYVVKPFEPKEFAARVQAKLKLNHSETLPKSFTKGPFHIDLVHQRVSLAGEGSSEQLNLTPIETKLMIHLLQNEGRVLSRQELIKLIWGEATHVSTHTVDTHISSLRKKIGTSAKCIQAVPRVGFCFQAEDEIKPPSSS